MAPAEVLVDHDAQPRPRSFVGGSRRETANGGAAHRTLMLRDCGTWPSKMVSSPSASSTADLSFSATRSTNLNRALTVSG